MAGDFVTPDLKAVLNVSCIDSSPVRQAMMHVWIALCRQSWHTQQQVVFNVLRCSPSYGEGTYVL